MSETVIETTKSKWQAMSRAERWLNGALGVAVLWCLGTAVVVRKMYAVSLGSWPIVLLGVVGSLLVLTLWRSQETKARVALSVWSIIVGLYIVEVGLYVWFSTQTPDAFLEVEHRAAKAREAGVAYDTRTKLDVLRDLRRDGVDAYPSVAPVLFSASDGIPLAEDALFPFGGISGVQTVFCNETGTWSVYQSDEHGFNNPPGLFQSGQADIALVGDSFTQGACVGPGEDVGSHLRQVRGGAETILNLGAWGNGPLLELAVLREYVRPLQPEKVVWLYYEHNDLEGRGLLTELRSPTLMRYLDEADFSQRLSERQGEVDSLLMAYVAAEEELQLAEGDGEAGEPYSKAYLPGLAWFLHTKVALRDLRILTSYGGHEWGGANTTGVSRHEWFRRILQTAKEDVEGWGGDLYFVYLPTWARYSPVVNQNALYDRREILSLVEEVGLPVIDFHEIVAARPEPRDLFPLQIHAHYTSEGYRLLAEEISRALDADASGTER